MNLVDTTASRSILSLHAESVEMSGVNNAWDENQRSVVLEHIENDAVGGKSMYMYTWGTPLGEGGWCEALSSR